MEMKDLLKKYKRGDITLDEFKNEIRKDKEKMKEREYDIDSALKNKLEKELKEFKKSLKHKSKEEIINSAYELVVKEEIKNELIYMELYDEEKEIIFLQDDVLNEFYHDWLNVDTPLGEALESSLEESVAMLTRYFGNKNRER